MMGDNGWDDDETIPIGPPGGGWNHESTNSKARSYTRVGEKRNAKFAPTPSQYEDRAWRECMQQVSKAMQKKPQATSLTSKFYGPSVEYSLHHLKHKKNSFIQSVAGFYFLYGFVTRAQMECLSIHLAEMGYTHMWESQTTLREVCRRCKKDYVRAVMHEANCPHCWRKRYNL